MRVIRDKATGKILEAQSGDKESFDALYKNALAAGRAPGSLVAEILPDAAVKAQLIAQDLAEAPPPAARPPSIEEQLAAIWAGGKAMEDMRARVQAFNK